MDKIKSSPGPGYYSNEYDNSILKSCKSSKAFSNNKKIGFGTHT